MCSAVTCVSLLSAVGFREPGLSGALVFSVSDYLWCLSVLGYPQMDSMLPLNSIKAGLQLITLRNKVNDVRRDNLGPQQKGSGEV